MHLQQSSSYIQRCLEITGSAILAIANYILTIVPSNHIFHYKHVNHSIIYIARFSKLPQHCVIQFCDLIKYCLHSRTCLKPFH